MFYKYEEGTTYCTVVTDCVIDAGLDHTISTYDNIEILKKIMPDFYDLEFVSRVSDSKKLMYGKQRLPWPMYHRDMCFYYTGVCDFENRAVLCVQKSKEG